MLKSIELELVIAPAKLTFLPSPPPKPGPTIEAILADVAGRIPDDLRPKRGRKFDEGPIREWGKQNLKAVPFDDVLTVFSVEPKPRDPKAKQVTFRAGGPFRFGDMGYSMSVYLMPNTPAEFADHDRLVAGDVIRVRGTITYMGFSGATQNGTTVTAMSFNVNIRDFTISPPGANGGGAK
jgi:hypothetical protein